MKPTNLSTIRSEIHTCCQTKRQYRSEGLAAETSADDRDHIALLSIAGMCFESRTEDIRETLKNVHGVLSAHVVFAGSAIKVRFDPAWTNVQAIIDALKTDDSGAGKSMEKPAYDVITEATRIGRNLLSICVTSAV